MYCFFNYLLSLFENKVTKITKKLITKITKKYHLFSTNSNISTLSVYKNYLVYFKL